MRKLLAVRQVLYENRRYQIGDALPAADAAMVAAWLRAGSAAWQTTETVPLSEVAESAEAAEVAEVPPPAPAPVLGRCAKERAR